MSKSSPPTDPIAVSGANWAAVDRLDHDGEDVPLTVAALDLGSNSFHMIIGRTTGHDLHIIDRLKETVRLASGLDESGRLTPESRDRAVACLERFGERLAALPRPRVRAVGTNTLRKAKDSKKFRKQARAALGHDIEVISGQEEARLIYLGVAHSAEPMEGRRLVVDIGGGSTEVILGEGFEMLEGHSLYMGCVIFSERFFGEGELTADNFKSAETAAALELRSIDRKMRQQGWSGAVGASGTINAISTICRENGWSDGALTLDLLKKLRKALIKAGKTSAVRLDGLTDSRQPVLPGGLAILIAVFKRLEIDTMTVSSGALREGVLYDLLGRIRHEDVRDRTIARMVDQYQVDAEQARRVEQTAHELLRQTAQKWDLIEGRGLHVLSWAAALHEVGLAVSWTGYHRHGAYLVANTDMPGFARDDQLLLAAVIRGHRRKIYPEVFEELTDNLVDVGRKLTAVLRLAVLWNRSRSEMPAPRLKVNGKGRTLRLTVDRDWEEQHPLLMADLREEAGYMRGLGLDLEIVEKKDD